jgi:uncharacterized DUF497 family protein
MDVHFTYAGQRFTWDAEKALANYAKHGVRFEHACEVFFDPFVRIVDATGGDEPREAALGLA